MGARRPANLLFISSATRCHLTLSQIFWDRIQPETFWLAGRKPWPATVFLIRDYPIFFALPKEFMCDWDGIMRPPLLTRLKDRLTRENSASL